MNLSFTILNLAILVPLGFLIFYTSLIGGDLDFFSLDLDLDLDLETVLPDIGLVFLN